MSGNSNQYDLVVVGCGGIGSSVLFHAAQLGVHVLGIEQFTVAHDRGSSHGQTRIIRQAYFEHPNYVPLLVEAYDQWRKLELFVDRRLFYQIGLIQAGPIDGVVVPGVLQSAKEHQLQVEHLTASQAAHRFPAFRIPDSHQAVFEPDAGYLLVEKCVAAHVDGGRQLGAEVRENVQLLGIDSLPTHVELNTSDGVIRAARVVLTVGAWLGRWFQHPNQPLQVLRKHLHWFQADDSRLNAAAQCPLFFFENQLGYYYGFPSIDGAGFKVAEHSGGESIDDPSGLDRNIDPTDLSRITDFLSSYFYGGFQHIGHSACMYTMTRDQHFIVDQHPELANVWIAGGFSGHGFKFASALGHLIARWCIHGQPDRRLEFLRLERSHLMNEKVIG